jgi:hypothetical protein
VMHKLGIAIKHSGRDNVGGTLLQAGEFEFDGGIGDELSFALIQESHLGCVAPPARLDLPSLPRLKEILHELGAADRSSDRPRNGHFADVSNCRIAARNMGAKVSYGKIMIIIMGASRTEYHGRPCAA